MWVRVHSVPSFIFVTTGSGTSTVWKLPSQLGVVVSAISCLTTARGLNIICANSNQLIRRSHVICIKIINFSRNAAHDLQNVVRPYYQEMAW